ncbi:hypothetical protein EON66_07015 [archaeon]|nr:MAG: hypothetical protein EON66_07015 [archaeon]
MQTTFVNLNVAIGLIALSSIVTDMIMMWLCPMRSLYRQYKVRGRSEAGPPRLRLRTVRAATQHHACCEPCAPPSVGAPNCQFC